MKWCLSSLTYRFKKKNWKIIHDISFKFFIEFGYYRKRKAVGCWSSRTHDENSPELLQANERYIGEGGNSKITADTEHGTGEPV